MAPCGSSGQARCKLQHVIEVYSDDVLLRSVGAVAGLNAASVLGLQVGSADGQKVLVRDGGGEVVAQAVGTKDVLAESAVEGACNWNYEVVALVA